MVSKPVNTTGSLKVNRVLFMLLFVKFSYGMSTSAWFPKNFYHSKVKKNLNHGPHNAGLLQWYPQRTHVPPFNARLFLFRKIIIPSFSFIFSPHRKKSHPGIWKPTVFFPNLVMGYGRIPAPATGQGFFMCTAEKLFIQNSGCGTVTTIKL
jgi:hypothetical protein